MIQDMTALTERIDQQQFVRDLVGRARAEGLDLVGPGGLLSGFTKQVIETALEEEMTEHLGYEKGDRDAKDGANERNGIRSKTIITDIGPVDIDVPRDRDGSFEPQLVAKRQRRLTGIDNLVLSLSARGLTTGEISAHFAEVYGSAVSKDVVSRITDKVVDEMVEWQNWPLDRIYPVVFIDAIVVKVRGRAGHEPAVLRCYRGLHRW